MLRFLFYIILPITYRNMFLLSFHSIHILYFFVILKSYKIIQYFSSIPCLCVNTTLSFLHHHSTFFKIPFFWSQFPKIFPSYYSHSFFVLTDPFTLPSYKHRFQITFSPEPLRFLHKLH
jgi:hypothetical protein